MAGMTERRPQRLAVAVSGRLSAPLAGMARDAIGLVLAMVNAVLWPFILWAMLT